MGRKFIFDFARIQVKEGAADGWVWKGRGDRRYSVKAGYEELSRRDAGVTTDAPWYSCWKGASNALAPQKVRVFTWQLLQDRLPTKMNLVRRNIVGEGDQLCCCCKMERSRSITSFSDAMRLGICGVKWLVGLGHAGFSRGRSINIGCHLQIFLVKVKHLVD